MYSATMEQRPPVVKERTLVFTLPKGSKVTYVDFLPILSPFQGRLNAFGTVGVGHIWHLTFLRPKDADKFCSDHPNFRVGEDNIHVEVSKYTDELNVGMLHWLPFWVPHEDVITAISQYTGERVSCQYIKIAQKGYQNCFSTQRSLQSPVTLKDLPHFFNVESEGSSYRVFLFVPGREPVCFGCKRTGHMKSSCPNSDVAVSVETRAEQQRDKPVQFNRQELVNLAVPPPSQPQAVPLETQEEPYEESESDGQMSEEQYSMSYLRTDGIPRFIARRGRPMIVTPPSRSRIDDDILYDLLDRCTDRKCNLLDPWQDEVISLAYMKAHIMRFHKTFEIVPQSYVDSLMDR